MKRLAEGHRPRFMSHTVEGYEQELSPELQALARDFAQQMAEEYNDRRKGIYDLLKRYPDDEGLKQLWGTPEKVDKYAAGEDEPEALERIRRMPFEDITWRDVQAATNQDVTRATVAMKAIYDGAADHISSGHYAARAVGFKKPFERMEFKAIRDGFIDEWRPRGGIEAGMVDMLAQCYVAWQFWLTRSFAVARRYDDVEEQVKKSKTMYEGGRWQPPRLTAAEDLERATQMADRYQRMYMRTLRQMRDLRRYAPPVIVNNQGGQVNIAAEGGQQVNLQKKVKQARKAKGRPRAHRGALE